MTSTSSPHELRTRSSQPEGRGLHVLLIEDDRDCAECLALLLRVGGRAVEIAGDGASALASLDHSAPDVVLIDIGLPDMDGYEVARRLCRVVAKKPLLVALTGHVRDNAEQRASEEGFAYHLVKPVDPAVLLALLDEYAKSL